MPDQFTSVFEEDDDFEEFQAEDWNEEEMQGAVNVDLKLWQDSWDDDVIDDDFALQLRAELDKVRQAAGA